MSVPYVRQVQVALFVLLTVTFLGGSDIPRGSGTWIAPAQAEDSKDDKDRKKDFDHFACYEVKCIDRHDRDRHSRGKECDTPEEKVTLFNQFTDDKDKKEHEVEGQKVLVGQLKLLCVPTYKEHDKEQEHDRR